jgi:hypothetical protein
MSCRLSQLIQIVLLLALSGCTGNLTGRLTYAEVMATAAAQGCWSSERATPLPITVTPWGGQPTRTPTAWATTMPQPTETALPTTTPLPRCTPGPGETQQPWPTPRPTEPPYPTRAPMQRDPISAPRMVMRVPNVALALDSATHPVQPAPVVVATIDIPVLNRDTARVFVRVFDPTVGQWTTTQTVSLPGSHPGSRFRSVATAITPDNTIHVVWGATEYPNLEIYAASSIDYGRSWSAPTLLGSGMVSVLDVATSATSNEVFVLGVQRDPAVAPVFFRRSEAGAWSEREVLPLDRAWYGSSGSLVVSGDGSEATLVALVTAHEREPRTVYLLRRPLTARAWSLVGSRTITHDNAGEIARGARGVAYTVRSGDDTIYQGITFTVTFADYPTVYAITSLDGGRSWGEAEQVVRYGQRAVGDDGTLILAAAPLFDAAARRLVTVWSCCVDTTWGNKEATHYASWSTPGSGVWTPAQGPGAESRRVEMISGAHSAGLTTIAQPRNGQLAWLVWVEDGMEVWVSTVRPNTIIPVTFYPAPTPQPTPGGS